MRHMETAGSKLLVIGAGPVGLSLAVGLAKRGHGVRLLDAGPDLRTAKTPAPARSTALMPLSLETLSELGVLDRVKHLSAPLDKLRLIDDQADRWTNPVIEVFSADEVTDTPFGYNIINTDLSRALLEAAEACPNRGGVKERAGRIITKVHPLNPPLFPRSRATFERPRDCPSRDVDKGTGL